ncbi:MAG: efflux transporter outer membrane subunit [Planctomycetota bacterium]|jgi:NodT family efflux transporter outer membrane factor (OMF) lipoprotein
MMRYLIAGGLVLSSCGCNLGQWVQNGFKLGPEYERPEAAVADQWIDAGDAQVNNQPPDHPEWWAVLNDPVLNQLVQDAAKQNLSVREAGYRVLQARAQRDIAIGNLSPQQQFGSGGVAWNQASENSGAPVSDPTFRNKLATGLGAVSNPPGYLFEQWVGAPGLDSTFRNWNFGASVAWELDIWGRFRRAVESADARLEASVQDYRSVLVSLTADVATAYVDVRTAQQRLNYARHNVEIQKGSLELSETQAREGKTSDVGVFLARSNLDTTRASIPGLEIDLRQANNRLCTLLGHPPRNLVTQWQSAGIPKAPPEILMGIPSDLLRRRPDVQLAERNLAAQSAEIGIAESELYPQFVLSGNIGLEAEDFSRLFQGDSFGYSAGPSFSWNILNYGRLINNVRFQEARFQELIATYQDTVLTANREAEDALISFLRLQEQAMALADSADAIQKALKLVLIQFEEGKIEFTPVFVLQGDLALVQDQQAAAEGSVILSLINLYKALGGGWSTLESPEMISVVAGEEVDSDQGDPPAAPTFDPVDKEGN